MINTYNGDGRRVGKSVNGSLTRYLYEYDKVVLEANYLGDQTGRNVYGINLITRQVGADTFTYMYNGHADVTALLDTAGNIAATYYYDAFGNILDQTGIVSNNILYAGYQYDSETGLYYLNARMYDPVTARFMQEDTYAGEYNDPLSLNRYTYCKNEPIRYSDPTGHRYDEGDKSNKDEKKLSKAKQQVKNTQHKLEVMEKRAGNQTKDTTLSAPAKAHTPPTPQAYQRTSLDNFLNPLNFVDKTRITSVLSNSNEPYKSAYLQSVNPNIFGFQNFYIADINYQGVNRFESFGGILQGNIKLDINATNVFQDSTFFHEWAHAVYQGYLGETGNITDSQKSELQEKIISDVTNNITDVTTDIYNIYATNGKMNTQIPQLSGSSSKGFMQKILEKQEIEEIVAFILDPDNNHKNTLNRGDLSQIQSQTVDSLRAYYKQELSGAENSMASDIYGGVTNNFIVGDYAHIEEDFYWYDKPFLSSELVLNGDLLTNEFFAEGSSTMLAGPEAMVNSAEMFFPSAMPELKNILTTTIN